jgi:DNA-binding transcriptional LysR family regulator
VSTLIYSFAQLEAFTAVVECGSLAKAAVKLGKDRTTLRDLIDFLEDGREQEYCVGRPFAP